MYLIAKILRNSLFGRMGMNPFLGKSRFILKNEYAKLLEKGKIKLANIEDEVDYGDYVLLTTNSCSDKNVGLDGNISVAIAITAYSRSLMSNVKNLPGVTIYYSDTDSIFTNIFLPENMEDPKQIGMWKLEDEYLYGVSLGPKTYGCLNTNLKKLFQNQRL